MATMPKLSALAAESGKPKSTWETIFTLTPVMLTLLATVLAGLSSSEMIQAQYYRSMAAQNQSKAGDQWGFFQAKRIRGTIVERLLAQGPGVAGPVDPRECQAAAQRLSDQVAALGEQARRLRSLVPAGAAIEQAAEKLVQVSKSAEPQTKAEVRNLAERLERPDIKTAFAYLGTGRLPDTDTAQTRDADIDAVLKAISDRQSEEEFVPLLLRIEPARVRGAVEAAESSARRFEEAAKSVDRSLDDVDAVFRRLRHSAYGLHRAAGNVGGAVAELAPEQASEPFRQAAAAIARADAAIQRTLDDVQDYRAAREDYTARRNEREARYNQSVAGLYELEVQQSSLQSERHRRRSKNFFYGMLCAQAGVATASISLAARRKSALWSMAGAAGLTALLFSIYIYLYV